MARVHEEELLKDTILMAQFVHLYRRRLPISYAITYSRIRRHDATQPHPGGEVGNTWGIRGPL